MRTQGHTHTRRDARKVGSATHKGAYTQHCALVWYGIGFYTHNRRLAVKLRGQSLAFWYPVVPPNKILGPEPADVGGLRARAGHSLSTLLLAYGHRGSHESLVYATMFCVRARACEYQLQMSGVYVHIVQ